MNKSPNKQADQSHRWSPITDRINERLQREDDEQDIGRVISAYRRDPIRRLLDDPWICWASKQPLLDAGHYVRALVSIANGESVSLELTLGLPSGAALNDVELREVRVAPTDKKWLESWQTSLRLIASSQSGADLKLRADLVRDVEANSVLRIIPDTAGRPLRYRLLTHRLSTALSYALLLLLDPAGPGKTLCECKDRECRRFFFAERQQDLPGRLKRDYCCGGHREREQRIKLRERVRKSREKSAAAKLARIPRQSK